MSSAQKRPFLTARWENLLLVNFKTKAEILEPYLPKGCVLDTYEGSPFVSLVAFEFLETKVFRVKWPGFTNFPEINLRFYIRFGEQRGVCFIREYVPSFLVSSIARWLYNEPYLSAKMKSNP